MAPTECQKNVPTIGFYTAFLVLQDLRRTPTKNDQISFLVNKAIGDWMVANPTWKTQMQLESFLPCSIDKLG